jgi:transposase
LVSDRATVFSFWVMAMRQICWAHLLRKFISFSERDGPAGRFGRELLEYTGLVFEYWQGFKDGKLTREELAGWLAPVRRHFERTLEAAAKADIARLSGACADILAHREALWTFLTEEGVEPTNNHAERELREFVLWRKRSFGSQSERGERFAERVMTVARTARKQGKAVLEFLVGSIKARQEGTAAPQLIAA